MFHSKGKFETHDPFPTGTRLRPDWAPHPLPNTITPNKASVEIEAALVLMTIFFVQIVFDSSSWQGDWPYTVGMMGVATYLGAVLSPERTFCDRMEVWLQLLLGWLLAMVFMLSIGLPVWSLIFSPIIGSVVAIGGNFLQRAMWEFA